ncbi:MAG: TIGR04282 family arsenosugar biosynthesis glycosyltransferase [Bacteroidetes bacterium]|nr:TIGR04282 family arsenosugar biosynthesis glycosyltransferase [Bacteroidota bacterium]
MNKNLLLIFTRNPELGKCKTRLAAAVGEQAALNIYKFLLQHTVNITQDLPTSKEVHYSVAVRNNDIWDETIYTKKQQHGDDLGLRMSHAFLQGFDEGYENIIIIGSDMYDLTQKELEEAFEALETNEFVVGPAQDGGYYLLGMKRHLTALFVNKAWGTNTVLADTKKDLIGRVVKFLKIKNDIDVYDDVKDIEIIKKKFLTHL